MTLTDSKLLKKFKHKKISLNSSALLVIYKSLEYFKKSRKPYANYARTVLKLF